MPKYTGKTGEVILVVGDGISKKYTKKVKQILEKEINYLPQSEKSFTVFTIHENKLDGIFKKHRNLFYLQKSDKNTLHLKSNLWAKNQLVYTYKTNQSKKATTILENKSDEIIETINNIEVERLQAKYTNQKVAAELLNTHSIKIKIPQHYTFAKNDTNFFWLRKETSKNSFGIIGYFGDRDSVLKNNIPGPTKNSFMKAINFEAFNTKKNKRGIWEVENDYMGGPYIETSVTVNNKNLHLFAYLYAPSKAKRELLRELEAIVKSAKTN